MRDLSRYDVDLEVCYSCKVDGLDEDGRLCRDCEIVPPSDTRRGRETYIDADGVEKYSDMDW